MRVFIVAYTDDEGPYAVAFSTRAAAETYAVNIGRNEVTGRGDVKVIDTEIDEHLDLIEDNQVGESA